VDERKHQIQGPPTDKTNSVEQKPQPEPQKKCCFFLY